MQILGIVEQIPQPAEEKINSFDRHLRTIIWPFFFFFFFLLFCFLFLENSAKGIHKNQLTSFFFTHKQDHRAIYILFQQRPL